MGLTAFNRFRREQAKLAEKNNEKKPEEVKPVEKSELDLASDLTDDSLEGKKKKNG